MPNSNLYLPIIWKMWKTNHGRIRVLFPIRIEQMTNRLTNVPTKAKTKEITNIARVLNVLFPPDCDVFPVPSKSSKPLISPSSSSEIRTLLFAADSGFENSKNHTTLANAPQKYKTTKLTHVMFTRVAKVQQHLRICTIIFSPST